MTTSAPPAARVFKRWTIAERKYAIRLYASGFSLREVRRVSGVSESTLRGWLDAEGIPRRDRMEESIKASKGIPRRGYKHLAEMARLYYDEQLCTTEVAERMGMHQTTVSYTLRKHGYVLRDKPETMVLAYAKGRKLAHPNFIYSQRKK